MFIHFNHPYLNNNLLVSSNSFYFLSLHLRLSTLFYSTQLIDIFAYELPLYKNFALQKVNKNILNSSLPNLVVYNFHSLLFQERFYLFILNFSNKINFKFFKKTFLISSITELFFAGN
jgi:hypothetical protein